VSAMRYAVTKGISEASIGSPDHHGLSAIRWTMSYQPCASRGLSGWCADRGRSTHLVVSTSRPRSRPREPESSVTSAAGRDKLSQQTLHAQHVRRRAIEGMRAQAERKRQDRKDDRAEQDAESQLGHRLLEVTEEPEDC